jgi:hypothetical protein
MGSLAASQLRAYATPLCSQRIGRAALPKITAQPGSARAPRALEDVMKVLTGRRDTASRALMGTVECGRMYQLY